MERKYNNDNREDRREYEKLGDRENRRNEGTYIFGVRAVIEAVKADREINKIFIQKGMNKELFMELKDSLANEKHQLQFVPVEKLDGITDQNHQGDYDAIHRS